MKLALYGSYALTKKNSSASPGNQPYLKMIAILTKTWTAIVSSLDERNTRTRARLGGYAWEKSDFFGALLASCVLSLSLSRAREYILTAFLSLDEIRDDSQSNQKRVLLAHLATKGTAEKNHHVVSKWCRTRDEKTNSTTQGILQKRLKTVLIKEQHYTVELYFFHQLTR